jgi:hypothetical protein
LGFILTLAEEKFKIPHKNSENVLKRYSKYPKNDPKANKKNTPSKNLSKNPFFSPLWDQHVSHWPSKKLNSSKYPSSPS